MKNAIIIALTALSFTLKAQTATYEIDPIKQDSFFLVETITGQVTEEFPRPQTTVTNVLYRSPNALLDLVEAMKKQATDDEAQAEKLIAGVKAKREMAGKIEAAIKAHLAFFVNSKNKTAKP